MSERERGASRQSNAPERGSSARAPNATERSRSATNDQRSPHAPERGSSARAANATEPPQRAHTSGVTNQRIDSRPHRVRHDDAVAQPYFVSTRCKRRVLMGEGARVAADSLLRQRDRYGFLLLAYCFMPNHAHFVVVPKEHETISRTMQLIKGTIARDVNHAIGREQPLWQSGFFDRVPGSLEELNEYIRYTHDNPVVAGLARASCDFAYSGATSAICEQDYRMFLERDFGASTAVDARAEDPRSEIGRISASTSGDMLAEGTPAEVSRGMESGGADGIG